MMEELLGQVKARILDIYRLEFQVETRAQAKRSKEEKQTKYGLEANCSRLCENFAFHKVFSKYRCYVMAWMQSHGNFSHRKVIISYELLEGEVFNSKFCINPLEPISMAIESSHYDHEKDKFAYLSMRDRIELGKRQVQQSQWGSKYALNEDISMKAKLASMDRRIEEFELRNMHLKHNHKPCQLHLSI
ncbi:hypothetical protein AAG906_018360 [Vitis piasezkii]